MNRTKKFKVTSARVKQMLRRRREDFKDCWDVIGEVDASHIIYKIGASLIAVALMGMFVYLYLWGNNNITRFRWLSQSIKATSEMVEERTKNPPKSVIAKSGDVVLHIAYHALEQDGMIRTMFIMEPNELQKAQEWLWQKGKSELEFDVPFYDGVIHFALDVEDVKNILDSCYEDEDKVYCFNYKVTPAIYGYDTFREKALTRALEFFIKGKCRNWNYNFTFLCFVLRNIVILLLCEIGFICLYVLVVLRIIDRRLRR